MRATSEAWEEVFRLKAFDTAADLHSITAEEIKSITGLEPRIMAKVDHSRDLPPVFQRYGYFLLPVRNGRYAIVRGNGFHQLEPTGGFATFESKIDFPLTTAGRGQSEMQYLDHAFNAGALEHILAAGPLFQSIRGREFCRSFRFRVGAIPLEVESVQIEVDSGLEGRQSIVLVEAKVGTPDDFMIRQLFYPYRHFQAVSPRKQIIPVFLTYELANQTYNLWVYGFEDPEDYNSIKLTGHHSFKIITKAPLRIDGIKPKGVVQYRELVPQANDLDKVIELAFKVSEGINDYRAIARHFSFDARQSSYYREASEALGLVCSERGKYSLTDIGKEFVALDAEQRNLFFAGLLADFHLIRLGLEILVEQKRLTKRDLEILIASGSPLTGSTIGRRASSLMSWFGWLAEHTGAFKTTNASFEI